MDLALLRKKPVVRMISSIWPRGAAARASGVGKRLEKGRSDHVDPHVGALGGEQGRRRREVPREYGDRGRTWTWGVSFVEGGEDGADAGRGRGPARGERETASLRELYGRTRSWAWGAMPFIGIEEVPLLFLSCHRAAGEGKVDSAGTRWHQKVTRASGPCFRIRIDSPQRRQASPVRP